MLTIDSINQRDGIEQQAELQQKGDFQDELQKLESVIRNLSSIQKSEDNQNDNEKHGNRSFAFQKLRLRRTKKKKVSSDNAEEIKEDFMERVQKLQSICKDLKDRLKADEDKDNDVTAAWAVKSPRIESRDDDGMISTGRENVEEGRIVGDRTEVLQAIAACAKLLSNFSMDPRTSKHSMEDCDIPVVEIELTESKFLEVVIDQDTQKQFTENVEKLVDEIEITESKFLEINADRETSEKLTDEIELTESKFLETKMSTENANTSMCYDINDCKMIEAIENLVKYLVVDESSEEESEEKEATCENTEETAIHDCFCGMPQLWDTPCEEAPFDEIGSLTEKEVSVNSNGETEEAKESEKEDEVGVLVKYLVVDESSEEESEEKEATCENTEETAIHDCFCGMPQLWDTPCEEAPFDEIGSLTEKEVSVNSNGETEEAKESEKEDEVGVSVDCDLSSLDRANTETEELTVKNFKRDEIYNGTSLYCNFFNYLGSLMEINTETESVETPKEKNREKKQDQKLDEREQTVDDFLEMTDQQCMTTFTSIFDIREYLGGKMSLLQVLGMYEKFLDYLVAGFQSSDSQARDEEGEKMQVEGNEAGERAINTVSTMDFIPKIEVVGFKVEKEEPKEEIDEQQITSVSTMDFIPRLEVVGFKEPENSKEPKNVKQSRHEGKSVAKKPFFKGKVSSFKRSEAKIEKLSHKEYRRMAAKNRRNKRKMKHLSKQERKSDALRLGTIQEAPENFEQPSYDSAYTIDKIQAKGNTMHRDTPDPRLVDQDNVVRTTPDNSEDLVNDDALICNVTSSLSIWTANKSDIKEVNIRQRESCDDDIDYENRLEKKPWFFQRLQEEHDEIMECLSPVLSIPAQSSFGTRNEYGNIEDDEYISHYYDFGEDDVGGNNNYDYEENVDDCDHEKYIYHGEEEDDDDDDVCYGKFFKFDDHDKK